MSTTEEFDVRSERLPGGVDVIHVTGELDLATAPRVEEALAALDGEVVVDLAQCTFLDSAGIRTLMGAARALGEGGHTLRVVSGDPGIVRLFELTGVDSVIPVHPSLDDAV